MGWLRKLAKAENEAGLRNALGRDAVDWRQWASTHGWTYQAEAPELVGRYLPEYSYEPHLGNSAPGSGAERYCHLLTTQLHGLRFLAFEHRKHSLSGFGDSSHSVQSFIVVQLPGLPPEDFVKMGPEKGIRELGGTVPNGNTLELVGDELVAHRTGQLDPISVEGTAELLALQVAAVPASFWRPGSSSGDPAV